MTRALVFIAAALAALTLAACGDDSDEDGERPPRESVGGAPIGARAKSCKIGAAGLSELRATGVDCGTARRVMLAWADAGTRCRPSPGGSRAACSVRSYRCLSVLAAAGGRVSVNCSQPGRSISFRSAKAKAQ